MEGNGTRAWDRIYRTRGRIVVKVGTSTLTHESGKLNFRQIERIVRVLSDLKNADREIILVTSGAIGVGRRKAGAAAAPLRRGRPAGGCGGGPMRADVYIR